MPNRHLCSHLLEIFIEGQSQLPGVVNLEQIGPNDAIVASEQALPTHAEVILRTEGFTAPASVEVCFRRETDYEALLVFRDGFRWSAEAWTPDHLFRVEQIAKGAAGSQ
ncbi:MAG: hypothetical protein GC160_01760 [Acidobacteria bacterium]|nr:hypothetical protein [Acidobacteriota bacterium]